MLQTLDQMTLSKAKPVPHQTWAAIPEFLDGKVAAGASKSSVAKTKSAVNGLLKSKGMTAENALVKLEWFDRMFPVDGWDPATMSFEQTTYQDYRNRARPVLEEMVGVAEEKKIIRAAIDGWDEAAKEFELLKAIAGPHRDKKMIPFRNTLTMAARRAGLGSGDINQPTTATRNVSGGSRCA
tara:strand:- start:4014 stop:4559 length:546 start_codon:yes stop_codon:yes gene_type:complete